MDESTPEITREHVARMQGLARSYYGTVLAAMVGIDEIESLATGQVLWDLAREYDPARTESFDKFLSMYARRRLVDTVRRVNGRNGSAKQDGKRRTNSYDGQDEDGYAPMLERLQNENADPVLHVIAQDQAREIMRLIRTQLTDRQRDAILEPLGRNDDAALAREWGMTVQTLHVHRMQAKRKIKQLLQERNA
jgi:DNA-directed RNA polymerase specialized sigma24 family protein